MYASLCMLCAGVNAVLKSKKNKKARLTYLTARLVFYKEHRWHVEYVRYWLILWGLGGWRAVGTV